MRDTWYAAAAAAAAVDLYSSRPLGLALGLNGKFSLVNFSEMWECHYAYGYGFPFIVQHGAQRNMHASHYLLLSA